MSDQRSSPALILGGLLGAIAGAVVSQRVVTPQRASSLGCLALGGLTGAVVGAGVAAIADTGLERRRVRLETTRASSKTETAGVGRNPCLNYLDYMEQHHPGKLGDPREWRRTYTDADSDIQLTCLAQLKTQQASDRRVAKGKAPIVMRS